MFRTGINIIGKNVNKGKHMNKEEWDNIINFQDPDEKKINKKKLIIAIIIGVIILIIFAIYMIYSVNEGFRNWWDINVLRKNIKEENLSYIQIDNVEPECIFAYSNCIAYIKDNKVAVYDSWANKIKTIEVQVTTPLIATNGEYAILAEKEGQKLYLISRDEILWEKEVEGNISRVNVNSNGYTSVIVSGTSYKSVIILFDYEGKELFKTYLSTAIAVDSDVSSDNKYMSFGEVNMSGTLVKSDVKIVSVEKAKEGKEDPIIYKYDAPSDSLILKVKYQGKNLICMYDNGIHIIENETDKQMLDLAEKSTNITFADIELNSNVVRCIEKNEGLFNTKTTIEIINSATDKKNIYNLNGSLKGLYPYGDKMGINLGLEVHFINTTGWLIKKYSSSEEVKSIVISNDVAGVIYKKKIEIIKI